MTQQEQERWLLDFVYAYTNEPWKLENQEFLDDIFRITKGRVGAPKARKLSDLDAHKWQVFNAGRSLERSETNGTT